MGEGSRRCSLLGPTEYRLCSFIFLASEQNHISSGSALLRGGSATVVSRVPIWGASAGYKHTTTACIDCFSVLNHSRVSNCCRTIIWMLLFIALFHMLSHESAGFKLLGWDLKVRPWENLLSECLESHHRALPQFRTAAPANTLCAIWQRLWRANAHVKREHSEQRSVWHLASIPAPPCSYYCIKVLAKSFCAANPSAVGNSEDGNYVNKWNEKPALTAA